MTRDGLFAINTDIPSEAAYEEARRRLDGIAKPIDGLGALERMLCRMAAIHRTADFGIDKKSLVIMCADNGVVSEGVTQTGSEVTAQVARLMGERMSSVGIMSSSYPLDIISVDIGIDSDEEIPGVRNHKVRRGTGDIAVTCAMSEEECLQAVDTGIGIVRDLKAGGCDLIATGEMGIGNTTTATAVMCALCGLSAGEVTGRGAGLDDEGLRRKTAVIDHALKLHGMGGDCAGRGIGSDGGACTGEGTEPQTIDPGYAFKVLHTLGGLDIAGLTGVFIGGAVCHIPVIIDGLISAAAALCAEMIRPGCRDYMIASHAGREKGCREILKRLGLHAVIDADMALGEGSGALLLMPMIDMAYSLYVHGTRFGDDTGIEHYERFVEV